MSKTLFPRERGYDPAQIVPHLRKCIETSNGFQACCPAHDDDEPSLSLKVENGRVTTWCCHRGCSYEDVKKALGLWQEKTSGNGSRLWTHIADYTYVDEDQNPLYIRRRYRDAHGKKQLRLFHSNGKTSGLPKGIKQTLYNRHLVSVLAKQGGRLFWCEGEKDCDALSKLDLVSTTTGGTTSWKLELAKFCIGVREVVILADADEEGEEYAQKVATDLHRRAGIPKIKIVRFENAPKKGYDVSDFLVDHNASKLMDLVENTPYWSQEPMTDKYPHDSDDKPTCSTAPEIDVTEVDLKMVTDGAWRAIHRSNRPPHVFRYGGIPARIETDDHGSPFARVLTEHRMRHVLARTATWSKTTKTNQNKLVPPPMEVVRDVLATPDPQLPILTRIVEVPVFSGTGTLLKTPGYHSLNQTYYRPPPGFVIPDVPQRPSEHEIQQAKNLILADLLCDFPFTGDSEIAHTLALMIVPFVRDLIPGPTPLHLFEKPSPGTGATLLAQVAILPAVGVRVPTMTEGRDDEEWRKRITAKLMTGPTGVLIDNLRRRLDTAQLSSAITSPMWEDRVLGHSQMARVDVKCIWVATGNNPALSEEMVRRTIRIRLDSKTERPWLRGDFRHPNLRDWAIEHRGELVWSALTLIQAWVVAGRPDGQNELGMFEHWSRTIGGILDVAGINGFLENLTEFYENNDEEGAAWRAFVDAWWQHHQEDEVGVSDLFSLLEKEGIELPVGSGNERSQKTRLGKLIATARDRRYGNRRVVKAGLRSRAQRWRLVLTEREETL